MIMMIGLACFGGWDTGRLVSFVMAVVGIAFLGRRTGLGLAFEYMLGQRTLLFVAICTWMTSLLQMRVFAQGFNVVRYKNCLVAGHEISTDIL